MAGQGSKDMLHLEISRLAGVRVARICFAGFAVSIPPHWAPRAPPSRFVFIRPPFFSPLAADPCAVSHAGGMRAALPVLFCLPAFRGTLPRSAFSLQHRLLRFPSAFSPPQLTVLQFLSFGRVPSLPPALALSLSLGSPAGPAFPMIALCVFGFSFPLP